MFAIGTDLLWDSGIICYQNFPQFYSLNFDIMALDNELETYIIDMQSSDDFLEVNGISCLAKKLIQTKRNVVHPLVYMLVKIISILPVVTATIERAFLVMNIDKNSFAKSDML